MEQPVFKRVLLKISGEALAGDKHFGLDFQVMGRVADVIKQCVDMGVQVGIVIGGGNFWRGVKDGEGHIERTRADHMGMLAHGHELHGHGGRAGAEGCGRAHPDRAGN